MLKAAILQDFLDADVVCMRHCQADVRHHPIITGAYKGNYHTLGSFRPAIFYVSETRACGKVFGKPLSGAEFMLSLELRAMDYQIPKLCLSDKKVA